MRAINWRPETAEDDAHMMDHLAPEEREIFAAQHAEGSPFPPPARAEDVQRFQTMARSTLSKSARIGLRLTTADLAAMKVRAAKHGIGSQTLIASLVHRYVTGQLVSRDACLPMSPGTFACGTAAKHERPSRSASPCRC